MSAERSLEKDAPIGCCLACDGFGGGTYGMCWDCRGTGCAHPEPCVFPPAVTEPGDDQ